MLRNYTGGATNSKEAPEMAEVKFGLCINHEEDIFMYQKTLTLGTKTISDQQFLLKLRQISMHLK